jgi:hypothetical protein
MTKARINKAIKHLGLVITGNIGDGYFYFLNENGDQVGDSVYVCYLNQLSLKGWISEAGLALEQFNNDKERSSGNPLNSLIKGKISV